MKKRTIHYITGDANEYDEIATICGIFIVNASALRDYGRDIKALRNRKYKLTTNPAAATCKKCMATEEWKKAVASKFADKMLSNK